MAKSYKQTKAIPPEIIQVWETAWEKLKANPESVFAITMPDRPKAMTFRVHLYTVKDRLIEENYLGANNFQKIVLSVPKDGMGNVIYMRMQPWLKGVTEALENEGVKPQHDLEPQPQAQQLGSPGELIPVSVQVLKDLFGPPTREETHE